MAAPKRNTPPGGFSPKFIESLRPGVAASDRGEHKGLRILVSPRGVRSFVWFVRHEGKQKKITFGNYPTLSLDDARKALKLHKLKHREGRLGALIGGEDASGTALSTGALTVRSAVARYVEYLRLDRRRPGHVERLFNHDILADEVVPKVADLALASLTSKHVRALVERVVARGSPVMAGHLLSEIKTWLRWHVDRDDLDASPAEKFRKAKVLGAKKATKRNRCLASGEIKPFLDALDAFAGLTPTVRLALKALLMTGVRSGELLQAEWSEIDLDAGLWTIPVAHQKMNKEREEDAEPWRVPLSPQAVGLLRQLKASADLLGSRFVCASFAASGEALSEKSLGHALRRIFAGEKPVLSLPGGPVTPHDMRRSFRDHIEHSLAFPEALAERCLNHARPGLVDTYTGDALDHRREALNAWGAFVDRLLSGESATVVSIRSGVRS